MVEIEITQEGAAVERHLLALPVLIGRDEQCSLRLRSWRIARTHARLSAHAGDLLLEDLGSWHGTWVNQRRVARYGPLQPEDIVVIGPCRLMVRRVTPLLPKNDTVPGEGSAARLAARLPLMGADPGTPTDRPPASRIRLEPGPDFQADPLSVTGLAALPAQPGQGSPQLADGEANLLDGQDTAGADVAGGWPVADTLLVRRLHAVLLQELDLRRRNVEDMNDAALRSQAREVLSAWLDRNGRAGDLSAQEGASEAGWPAEGAARQALLERVLDEALGYGPLQPLLAEEGITEIMVNGHNEIYVERQGRLLRHPAAFSSEAALMAVMERMVAPVGRRLDENMPLADARLPDGSRVHAVIRPVAVRGPSLTIRRFPVHRPGLPELTQWGALDGAMASFLAQCVRLRRNIIVSGGTGSGKTTLLNALSHCIAAHERVITIEDAAELRLLHAHRVVLEARPPNQEGKGAITIRELVRNALRMRPDRIIVGECRGPEALDMLAAMNTGHEGSLTTLHANSPRDALARLETMVLMAGMSLPLAAVREQIAASVDLLVQLVRLPDGRRVVSEVTELCGVESQCLQTLPLFQFDRRLGRHRHGENAPTFFETWRSQGLSFDATPFGGPDRVAAWSGDGADALPALAAQAVERLSWQEAAGGRGAVP
ncbi:Pertussis toxin liberation protein H [Kerstersia similis]